MIISFVIPAFNASHTIGDSLDSVYAPTLPGSWELEVIVVDDGSSDGDQLRQVVSLYEPAILIVCPQNKGKIAAMNTVVPRTKGDVVVFLDADDRLLGDWPQALERILRSWPQNAPLCFSACKTASGKSTVADPWYTGPLSFYDILNERHMGEYLPLFWGAAIREGQGYRDPGKGVGCELWTYLSYAQQADLWISSEVMRVYNVGSPGSLSSALFTPAGASRMVDCYELVFAEFSEAYERHSPRNLGRRRLRQAVFAAVAGDRRRAWRIWKQGARISSPLETLGALFLIALGGRAIGNLVMIAKKLRLVRQYG